MKIQRCPPSPRATSRCWRAIGLQLLWSSVRRDAALVSINQSVNGSVIEFPARRRRRRGECSLAWPGLVSLFWSPFPWFCFPFISLLFSHFPFYKAHVDWKESWVYICCCVPPHFLHHTLTAFTSWMFVYLYALPVRLYITSLGWHLGRLVQR